jgi:hypothetical protein
MADLYPLVAAAQGAIGVLAAAVEEHSRRE